MLRTGIFLLVHFSRDLCLVSAQGSKPSQSRNPSRPISATPLAMSMRMLHPFGLFNYPHSQFMSECRTSEFCTAFIGNIQFHMFPVSCKTDQKILIFSNKDFVLNMHFEFEPFSPQYSCISPAHILCIHTPKTDHLFPGQFVYPVRSSQGQRVLGSQRPRCFPSRYTWC